MWASHLCGRGFLLFVANYGVDNPFNSKFKSFDASIDKSTKEKRDVNFSAKNKKIKKKIISKQNKRVLKRQRPKRKKFGAKFTTCSQHEVAA